MRLLRNMLIYNLKDSDNMIKYYWNRVILAEVKEELI